MYYLPPPRHRQIIGTNADSPSPDTRRALRPRQRRRRASELGGRAKLEHGQRPSRSTVPTRLHCERMAVLAHERSGWLTIKPTGAQHQASLRTHREVSTTPATPDLRRRCGFRGSWWRGRRRSRPRWRGRSCGRSGGARRGSPSAVTTWLMTAEWSLAEMPLKRAPCGVGVSPGVPVRGSA